MADYQLPAIYDRVESHPLAIEFEYSDNEFGDHTRLLGWQGTSQEVGVSLILQTHASKSRHCLATVCTCPYTVTTCLQVRAALPQRRCYILLLSTKSALFVNEYTRRNASLQVVLGGRSSAAPGYKGGVSVCSFMVIIVQHACHSEVPGLRCAINLHTPSWTRHRPRSF